MKHLSLFLLVLFLALPALAERFKLYLTDGSYQMVSKYEVLKDRVRYYSVERGQWEEIPLSLANLSRTRQELDRQTQEIRKEQKEIQEEEAFEKAMRDVVSRVPREPGVYQVLGEEIRPLPQAKLTKNENNRRALLQRIVPIPVVVGKTAVEIEGEKSSYVVDTPEPEFYIRLARDEDFGIVRLQPGKKETRVVETISSVRQIPDVAEERDLVNTFRHEAEPLLQKVWPVMALTPGEYAVVEFTEGATNIQVWDFSYPGKTSPSK